MKYMQIFWFFFGVLYSVFAGENLLKNASFGEKGAKGIPLGWSAPGFVCKAFVDASATDANSLALKINSVQKMQGFIEQRVKLEPKRIYRLTGELRSSRPGAAFFQVKSGSKRFNSPYSETKWRKVSVDFPVLDAKKTGILCRSLFMSEFQGTLCEFRNLELTDTGIAGTEVPQPTVNLLPNSSFEEGRDARQTYAFVGDARHYADSAWKISTDCSYAGKQSLLMTGKQPFLWEVLNRKSFKSVFSVYLKGEGGNEEVELGLEPLFLGVQGGISIPKTVSKSFKISSDWKRYEISFEADKSKLNGLSVMQFYRVWVRPLRKGKIWADAAQLEIGRTEASAYSSVRGERKAPFAYNEIVKGAKDEPEWENKKSKTGQLALSVAAQDSRGFKSFPVWAGIPFPRGELFDEKAVELLDENGMVVPCQSRALARRFDGSIISLLFDFQADRGKKYKLHYGGETEKKLKDLAFLEDGKIIIDTGSVLAEIDPEKFQVFSRITDKKTGQSITAPGKGIFVKTPDGREYTSANVKPEEIVIERNGPLHVVIKASGNHSTPDGQTLLHYVVRIHAFAGKPYFMIETSFENRETGFNELVKSIGLELPLPENKALVCRFADGGSETLERGKDGLEIAQLHEVYGLGEYDLIVNADSRKVLRGKKSSGVFSSGNSTVAVRNFWQLNPKSVKFAKGKVSVFHWPEKEVKFADLPYGMASTMTMVYAPFGGGDDAAKLAENPPLLQTGPEWNAKSGVFGNFLTAKESAKEYPRYHKCLERLFADTEEFIPTVDLTGMSEYGEIGNLKSKKNNESVIAMNSWLQYLREGSPALFNSARAMTLHQREIDVCHAGKGACFMHTHCALVNTSYFFHTGHFWITGLIWHYLLTGDMRSYNVARDLGAHLLLKYRLSYYKGRERARMLLHLAELYELTHLKCFRHAYETHYNFGQPTPTKSDYYIGIGLLCLKRWYDVTGEKKYLDRFIKDSYNILKLRIACNYGKDSFALPDYAIGGGRDWYIFQAMAEAAETTGDKKFITVFSDWFVWHMMHLTGFAPNAAQGSYFLKAARKFGIGENPLMPENLLGIYPMIGCFCGSFNVLLSPKEEANLRVYKLRPFRYWQSIKKKGEDSIKYKVTAPDGKIVADKSMSGPEPGQIASVDLSPVEKGKFYQLELKSVNDAWGAVSSSTPNIYLKTNQYFAARMPRMGANMFSFVGIAPEKLDISLRWWSKGKIEPMGKIFGLTVQDLKGKTIAHKRWAVPVGTCFDKDGSRMRLLTDKLSVDIPQCGKPVKFFIAAPKYTKWKLENLKPSLLAPTASGFPSP